MPPRLYVDLPLQEGSALALPADAVRHIQVLRLQPGSEITLFNGQGGEWPAQVIRMGRKDCDVQIAAHRPVDRELKVAVSLAIGMPTNERMDAVVEKATELGAAAIEPLMCDRSVLRLSGERAERRCSHWQAIAVAAAEQSGRTRVPSVLPIGTIAAALSAPRDEDDSQWLVLSLAEGSRPAAEVIAPLLASNRGLRIFSGPEGGLSPGEEAWAARAGAVPISLGPRVLRADTAPLAVLALIGALGAAESLKLLRLAPATPSPAESGSNSSRGKSMGLLDSVIGMVAGQQGGAGGLGGNADLLRIVMSLLANNSQTGGLAGLVEKFQQSGLGDVVGSWVGTGQNLPVSPGQVSSALGPDILAQIAQQLGLSHEQAASQVAEVLPQVVDHATPEGQLPSGGLGDIGALLGQLSGR